MIKSGYKAKFEGSVLKLLQTKGSLKGYSDVFYSENYDSAIHVLTEIVFEDDTFIWNYRDKSDAEIERDIRNESEQRKQEQLEVIKTERAESDAQTLSDEDALNVLDVYPFWDGNGVAYEIDFKVKFLVENTIKLYKVVQAHTSQADWTPPTVPALFTRVQLDEILVWVQPTGAQDAYNIGDQVLYPDENGDVWESTVDANVFAPGVVQGQWILI